MRNRVLWSFLVIGIFLVWWPVARGMEAPPAAETENERIYNESVAKLEETEQAQAQEAFKAKFADIPVLAKRMEAQRAYYAEIARTVEVQRAIKIRKMIAENEERKAALAAEDRVRAATAGMGAEEKRKYVLAQAQKGLKTAREQLELELYDKAASGRGPERDPSTPVTISKIADYVKAQPFAIPHKLHKQAATEPRVTFTNWKELEAPGRSGFRRTQPLHKIDLDFFGVDRDFSLAAYNCAARELRCALVLKFPGEYGETLRDKPSLLLYGHYSTTFDLYVRNVLMLVHDLLDQTGTSKQEPVRRILARHIFEMFNTLERALGQETTEKEKKSFVARATLNRAPDVPKAIYDGENKVQWVGRDGALHEVTGYSFEHIILELAHFFVTEYIWRFVSDPHSEYYIADADFIRRYLFDGLELAALLSDNYLKMKSFFHSRIFQCPLKSMFTTPMGTGNLLYDFSNYMANIYGQNERGTTIFSLAEKLPGEQSRHADACGLHFTTSRSLPPTKLEQLKTTITTLQRNLTAISQKLTRLKSK